MHLMELFSAMQPGAEKPLKLKEKGIANFIIKNCSESLDAFQTAGAPLLRGLHGVAGLVFVGQSRTDGSRRPVDVPIDIQRAFDKKLSAAGFTALRSNSIFCSSSIAVAENYGVPYVIFPINGFTYAWSSLTEDFQDDIDPKLQRFTNSPLLSLIQHATPKQLVKDGKFYNSTGLVRALETKHEVYIHGKYPCS